MGLFPIFGLWSITYKKKFHNSRTSDDIDSDENCDVIAIFPIYGQVGAIRKQDSGRIAYITYIFINSILLSNKN